MSFQKTVDEQIKEANARGEFDNLWQRESLLIGIPILSRERVAKLLEH